MGLFDGVVADRKDDKIVTKTVQGKNTEVGRRKIDLIEEMRSQGYELVNEISESGVVEGYFGNTTPGTRYTLTFRLNEQLAAEIKAREEKRRKEEEARIRRQKREEAARERKEKQEEEERQREFDEKEACLKEPLGSGWAVVAEGGKNAKNAVKAAKAFMKEQNWGPRTVKFYLKSFKQTVKSNGEAWILNDYGENICKMFSEKLNAFKNCSRVTVFDADAFERQKNAFGYGAEFGDQYLHTILTGEIYAKKPTAAYKKLLSAAAGKKKK